MDLFNLNHFKFLLRDHTNLVLTNQIKLLCSFDDAVCRSDNGHICLVVNDWNLDTLFGDQHVGFEVIRLNNIFQGDSEAAGYSGERIALFNCIKKVFGRHGNLYGLAGLNIMAVINSIVALMASVSEPKSTAMLESESPG